MSFNFIPFTLENENTTEKLPVFEELARDKSTMNLLTKNGNFYTVSRNEALKIWILKALNIQTSRYEHRAYSNDYGNEITKLFGRHLKDTLLKAELKRYIEEALLVNPYIKGLSNFTFKKAGSVVDVTFSVLTVYGEFEQNIIYEN